MRYVKFIAATHRRSLALIASATMRTVVPGVALILMAGVVPVHAQCGTPPTCNGLNATIYVAAGIICGGPNNGTPYAGTLQGTSAADVMVGTAAGDTIN